MSKVKNIVTIGGGTGTFVVQSGLKKLPNVSLTAIVSVADDGGATGRLRDAYGFLPLGDARQALIALAENGESSLIRRLFGYRFPKGDVAGHNFGNLFLTALTDMLGSDAEAIEAASQILRIKGKVIPVSDTPGTLVAHLEDGTTIVGEHTIDTPTPGRAHIATLESKEPVEVSKDACAAINRADLIVLGPGDLYASTLANFTVTGLKECVQKSKAKLVYIVNLFTKAGQTQGYGATKYVDEITRYAGRRPDVILVSTSTFPQEALDRYAVEGEFPVADDLGGDPSVVRGEFASATVVEKSNADVVSRSLIRHDSEKVAEAIARLL
jgi:uncharacterized cofD-like protein